MYRVSRCCNEEENSAEADENTQTEGNKDHQNRRINTVQTQEHRYCEEEKNRRKRESSPTEAYQNDEETAEEKKFSMDPPQVVTQTVDTSDTVLLKRINN